MEMYMINKINDWPEEFTPEECIFLDVLAKSSATSIWRLWGDMNPNNSKLWPAVFYGIYDLERKLPWDILPNLKPGKKLDLKTGKYI